MLKRFSIILVLLCVFTTLPITSTFAEEDKTISETVKGMKKLSGLFDFYWDEKTGKIWLQIDKFDVEFLYINSLAAGVGSNDIGLDRGQLGDTRIVKFMRSGPKVLMIQPNYDYRANSDNQDEVLSVKEAFAESVLWGFDAKVIEGNTALIDFTDFLIRDAHDVVGSLKNTKQGSYRAVASRSAVFMDRTKNFPKNSEFEAIVSFEGQPDGNYVWQVVPSPTNITVRQHHSFIELPDNNFEPREFDPRAGYFPLQYLGLCHTNRRTDCKKIDLQTQTKEKESRGGNQRGS